MAGHVSALLDTCARTEHCMVCGFSEPMVYTKTVCTKCSTVRPTVLAKLLYAILHGPASVLQQTSASLTDSSTDVDNKKAVL